MKKDWHDLSNVFCELKKELVKSDPGIRTAEPIPVLGSGLPIDESDLKLLHEFAVSNPMYAVPYERMLGTVRCAVYKGDTDRYWLGSINHDSSRAPFSPTWIMSAYVLGMIAGDLGYTEAVDIGSGDGRIALCSGIAGMESHAIEIDPALARLPSSIGMTIKPHCSDAITFDYSILNLSNPVFFIGGLAQMGGDALASGVMRQVRQIPGLWENAGWVFAGTHAPKYAQDSQGCAGWGTIMKENGLEHARTITLPTAWTL
ncbi:MAG: hypothetical protein EB829_02095, partial [Nitrosopumilus sp. H8]